VTEPGIPSDVPDADRAEQEALLDPPAVATAGEAAPPAGDVAKLPGSEWLFAKLYVPPDRENELLAGPVRELCELAVLGGAAHDWFFLRYTDPGSHLRLRFRGDPEALTDLLVPRLFRWAAGLQQAGLISALALDTYEREVDRYGGPAAIGLAEDVFCGDSAAVVELLEAIRVSDGELDPVTCACVAVDGLLSALGYDVPQRLAWYQAQVRDRRASGAEYRKRSAALRVLLPAPQTLGDAPSAALAERHARLRPVGEQLAELEGRGELVATRSAILASHVHMHLNRLLGRRTEEDLVLGLLLRTWHGLATSRR
jgi:thiopeptide-type bacteriocin biosynthesis protein